MNEPSPEPAPAAEPRPKSNRGFAVMDPAQQREIASLGGKTAHLKGKAHKWTSETAAAAGRKGGKARKTKATTSA